MGRQQIDDERNEDIPLLISHFIETSRKSMNKNIQGLRKEVSTLLMQYTWPGNVRELRSTIHFACALCPGEVIEREHLPPEFLSAVTAGSDNDVSTGFVPTNTDTPQSEKEAILAVLNKTDWNKAKSARLLGMSRATLYSKLLKYGIEQKG